MAVWTDRVPVDEISERAQQIRFGRTLLTFVGGLLFGLGWTVARACRVAWAAVAWSVAAMQVGWREGMAGRTADEGETS